MTAAISVGTALAIGAATTAAGVAYSAYSSNKAASAQENAANNATNAQTSMFDRIQNNEAPWVQTGGQAQSALAQFYGLKGTAGGAPDYNKILSNLPGYQFQKQQGNQAVQRNMAANGLLDSGAAQKSLVQYGQGLAQSYAGQYASGLQNLSQMGEAGAAGVASAGMNSVNQSGSYQLYGGNAAAAGYANTSNAVTGGFGGLAGLAGYAGMQNPSSYAGQYGGQGVYGNAGGVSPSGYIDQGGYLINQPVTP